MADWMEDPRRAEAAPSSTKGLHAFDLLHWFVGDVEAVCSATAKTAKLALGVEDNAMTLVRFEGGALGSLSTLWSLNIDIGMRSTLQLFGTNGTLFVDLNDKAPGLSLYSESAERQNASRMDESSPQTGRYRATRLSELADPRAAL